MARVMTGDVSMFSAALYGAPQQAVVQNVREHLYAVGSRLGEMGQSIIQYAEEKIDEAVNSDAYRLANAALRRVASLWDVNEIRALQEYYHVQNAQSVMIPYVMAEPTIRKLYQQGLCEAYGAEYHDKHKQDIGENHLEWRQVMNGIATIGGDDDTFDWEATTYSDSFDDSVPLEFEQQLDILTSWDTIRRAIADGVDPTSRYDANL